MIVGMSEDLSQERKGLYIHKILLRKPEETSPLNGTSRTAHHFERLLPS